MNKKIKKMCEPTRKGICDCRGAVITCLCGICVKCGRSIERKNKNETDVVQDT